MKTLIKTAAVISFIAFTSTSIFGKTRTMTINQFQLYINKIDSSVVGTWEKNWNINQQSKIEFCQFNPNGTYIAFQKRNNKYVVTGRGNWNTEKGTLTIMQGNEISSASKYTSDGNYLMFENNISYSKPAAAIANK
ncbi:MAG: hypothetical protein KDD21_01690 [Bacteroidetes bacterium]|nr:hypothetical protein [Bacteroidota bacterium]